MKLLSFFKFPYKINKDTMLILPATDWNYKTKVIEANREVILQDTPINLIQQACIKAGSTLEERQIAVSYLTGFIGRVPTPIIPRQNIYAFPTHMPYHYDCCWIFPQHIHKIIQNRKNAKKSIIFFKNNLSMIVDIPAYILLLQFRRTPQCIHRYSNWIKQGNKDQDAFIS